MRHYHRTQARRVVEFVVQLEIEIRNEWKPLIRYDTAHGASGDYEAGSARCGRIYEIDRGSKVQPVERALREKAGEEGPTGSVTVKKLGPVHSQIEELALEHAA